MVLNLRRWPCHDISIANITTAIIAMWLISLPGNSPTFHKHLEEVPRSCSCSRHRARRNLSLESPSPHTFFSKSKRTAWSAKFPLNLFIWTHFPKSYNNLYVGIKYFPRPQRK
ncbi:hypothetical protein MLD38_014292 [Melastoma candidum]|uniref:Uncharacterized protein n=1 Tax=Melastoma candidum TaxID=119954 RepID=A0ACB9RCA2_9MYRT|nr:hypothetical protein MLD38_014292 [Melastoma candidum]